ncbi:MAG: hypothetical protein GX111_08925 [Clostridiales bacterium]|jgi:hypothetical protein|nr:hypothetical protein [Clostridiales bacterium]
MKKILRTVLLVVLGIAIGAGAFWLLDGREKAVIGSYNYPGKVSSTDNAGNTECVLKNWQAVNLAYLTVSFLRLNDYVSLSTLVNPEFGLVLSPTPTVSLSSNQCFSAEQVAAFGSDITEYVWGVTNGSGEPIELTPSEYFARYVYKQDYAFAKTIGVNQIVRSGNALENVPEVFPDAEFVDFYMPGETIGETDSSWTILRLVFEENDGKLMLAAIIHSEYTA